MWCPLLAKRYNCNYKKQANNHVTIELMSLTLSLSIVREHLHAQSIRSATLNNLPKIVAIYVETRVEYVKTWKCHSNLND